MTITEMKAQKEKFQKEADLLRQLEMQEEMQRIEAEKKMLEDKGCGWGMGKIKKFLIGASDLVLFQYPNKTKLQNSTI